MKITLPVTVLDLYMTMTNRMMIILLTKVLLVLEPTSTSVSKYLVTPKQVCTSKPSIKRIKSCGLVMTSMDIAEALERKEKKKRKACKRDQLN